MILYGEKDCPGCLEAKKELDAAGISYEFHDLAEVKNLKAFLELRDNLDIYDEVKAAGKVGIPTFILPNDKVTMDLDEVKKFFAK